MSIQALVWVIEHSQSRLADRCVLISIANHCDRDGDNAWPSIQTISHEAKLSVRQVQGSIARLSKMGELRVARNRGPHGTNLFSLPRLKVVNTTLLGKIPDQEMGGAESAGVQNLRGERFTNEVQNSVRKPHNSAPEPSLESSLEPSFHASQVSTTRPEDMSFFQRELSDMRRPGPVGQATRRHWRESLTETNEVGSLPEWFLRETRKLLNN
jgi:Helix-turn-helix domain